MRSARALAEGIKTRLILNLDGRVRNAELVFENVMDGDENPMGGWHVGDADMQREDEVFIGKRPDVDVMHVNSAGYVTGDHLTDGVGIDLFRRPL